MANLEMELIQIEILLLKPLVSVQGEPLMLLLPEEAQHVRFLTTVL